MTTTKRQRNISRTVRWLGLPKEKKDRILARFDRWMLRRLAKYGPGPEKSYDEQLADKMLRIQVQRQNELFHKKYPNFG